MDGRIGIRIPVKAFSTLLGDSRAFFFCPLCRYQNLLLGDDEDDEDGAAMARGE